MLYEAVHPVLGTRVVIKTIRPELAHDKTVVGRFLNEALSACRIRDDRLPGIYDHDTLPDGSPYMVMELLEGEDLSQRLAGGALSAPVAARVMVEVLEVLAKVHQIGIIHRDIKPQNIFLARSDLVGEVPKLLDFGVAHIANDSMTRPGEVMGTPMYMALEQAQAAGRVGPWTDVFSAGVVLYECLAGPGQRPWGLGTALSYITRLSSGAPPRPLEELAPEAPHGLCAAVMRAIAVDPDARFPDAGSFLRAIEPYAEPRAAVFREPARVASPAAAPVATAETAWARPSAAPPVTPTRRTRRSGPEADAVHRLRDRLAHLGGNRAETGAARLRPGERHHIVVLALSFDLGAGVDMGLHPEEVDDLLVHINEIFDHELESQGARVEQHLGRALLATFGHDEVSEEDGWRAARAALRLIERRRDLEAALGEIGCGITLRIGVHAGFVVRATEETASGRTPVPATGDTVNVARFLESTAPLNGIQASRSVREAAGNHFTWRSLGPREVRGRAEPVEVYELMGVETNPSWLRQRRHPFVGRVAQVAALLGMVERAGEPGAARLALVEGPPGHGKTRLLQEATGRLQATGMARVVSADAVADQPYGLWVSLLDHLLDLAHQTPFDALDRLDPALGQHAELVELVRGRDEPEPGRLVAPDLLRARLRTMLAEVLAAAARQSWEGRRQRLVLALDSLHRADEASLELLASLPESLAAADGPVFFVGARSGQAPTLPPALPAQEVALGRLSDAEVAAMIDQLAGGRTVSAAARALVSERAAGNPLFLEELVAALLEDELADADTLVLAGFRVPGSLFGMLLARLNRLSPRLREVVRHLSVFGMGIQPSLWTKVSDALAVQDEQTRPGNLTTATDELRALVSAGVLEAAPGDGDVELRFRQSLLREAVYATILPENRRLLHRLIAETLETLPPEQHARLGPQLLNHYRQAGVIERTVFYGRRVGRRALRLGAYGEAVQALQIAVASQGRLREDAAEPARTLLDLAWTLLYVGRFDEAADRARDAGVLAEEQPSQAGRAHLVCAQVAYLRGAWEDAREELEMAEHLFDEAGDEVEAARSRSAQGFVLRCMGQPAEGLPLAESGWTVLRQAGDRSAILRAAHDLGNVLRDLHRLEEALAVLEEALGAAAGLAELPRAQVGPGEVWVEPAVRSARAILYADLGRHDEAIVIQEAIYAEGKSQGNKVTQTLASFHLAHHLAAAGRLGDAERWAAIALEGAGEVGMPDRAVRARLLLADIEGRRGRVGPALEHLAASEFLARTAVAQQSSAADSLWLRAASPLADALVAAGRGAEVAPLMREARRRLAASVEPPVVAGLQGLIDRIQARLTP
ncbi:MAG: AAA family ATPase [Myxococcales bacterium]|nr:AAA family ATPase [Myxococcales bacterium]